MLRLGFDTAAVRFAVGSGSVESLAVSEFSERSEPPHVGFYRIRMVTARGC